jgi:hypothetical protein
MGCQRQAEGGYDDVSHTYHLRTGPARRRSRLAFDRQARARAATRRHRNRAVGLLALLSADDLAHHQRGAERDLVAGQSLAIR